MVETTRNPFEPELKFVIVSEAAVGSLMTQTPI